LLIEAPQPTVAAFQVSPGVVLVVLELLAGDVTVGVLGVVEPIIVKFCTVIDVFMLLTESLA
jgi:hypothetical protein